jgi:hypothetical protein
LYSYSFQQAKHSAQNCHQAWRQNPHIPLEIRADLNSFATSNLNNATPDEIWQCLKKIKQEPEDVAEDY